MREYVLICVYFIILNVIRAGINKAFDVLEEKVSSKVYNALCAGTIAILVGISLFMFKFIK